jgi:hypothetical protein
MFPMDLKRFVRVTAEAGGQRGGTGYLVHGDRVLTARHVIEAATRIAVSFDFDDLTGQHVRTATAEVVWEAEGDLDVAVLGVRTDLRLARQLLHPAPLPGNRPWESRGWALAAPPPGDPEGSIVNSMSPLWGMAPRFATDARQFEVSVEASPAGVEWWRGASGAPVFCDGRLVGVIYGAPEPFDGKRLYAAPIAALWRAAGFREAVGYSGGDDDLRRKRMTELVDHLAALLGRSAETAHAIAEEASEWKRALSDPDHGGAASLAEALSASPSWRAVADAFDRAHDKVSHREGPKYAVAAQAMVEILERLLPEIYGATELHLLPGMPGGQLLTLPIETLTLAEVAMAAFDGRGVAFQEVASRQRFPHGRALVKLGDDRQEQGFDFKQEQAFHDWLLLLASWLKLDEDDLRTVSRPERSEALAPLVNLQIERDVRFGEPRRYFAFSREFAEKHRAFLARVREQVPALHLVELAAKTLVEERIACEPLQSILFRSFRGRKRKK